MTVDPRSLRPFDALRILNSTSLGTVLDERQLLRHRAQGGLRIGDGKRVDLIGYIAWLFERKHAPKTTVDPASAYADLKAKVAERNKSISQAGRDIGDLPPIVNPARREAARLDFRVFCDEYFARTFTLPWSPDHLKVIARVQQCVLEGGQFALAMPRGSGKTSLCVTACVWATIFGHKRFVCLVGQTEGHAQEMLESIGMALESNDELLADFPEVCFPIRALDGIANRCSGQLYQGTRTHITWTATVLVLPTIAGSVANGAIIKVAGITGRIRGMQVRRVDGETARPDIVVIDDCQTDESSRSLSQCVTRERILSGAILGLGGPDEKISAIMPCTVIRPGDLADTILDRKKHPEWNGERLKMMYVFPTSKRWDAYAEMRAESLRKFGDIREATAFYREHQAELDEGAVIGWEHRFLHDEASAIQHAMNLKLQDEVAFYAEYQNEPLAERGIEDAGILTADQIAQKLNGYKRGVVPIGATHLTAFVDVQEKLLYWAVVAWHDNFTGYVIDYGAYPDPAREYFTLADAEKTLTFVAKNSGVEGAIFAGLEALIDELLGAPWQREDDVSMHIGLCLIDANWSTDVVYQFCRQSPHAALLHPTHSRYFGASARPFQEWAKKPGDRVGLNWRVPVSKGKRAVRHALFDTNFWKTFVHSRLAVSMGDVGCLSFYGRASARHRMIAEHLTSESRNRVQGHSRVVDEWRLKPGVRENHLFDCVVGASVAASMVGVALPTMEPPVRARRVVSVRELQEEAREQRRARGW